MSPDLLVTGQKMRGKRETKKTYKEEQMETNRNGEPQMKWE